MIDPQIRIDLDDLEEMTEAYGTKLAKSVRVGVREAILLNVRDVTKTKLRGQYLNRRTGTLIRSVTASRSDEMTETMVRGSFGTHLDYGKAHEVGFRGQVQVAAHTRRLVRTRTNRQGQLSKKSAKALKRKLQRGLKTTAHVRAHSRRVNIRPRYYLRDTLRENIGKTKQRVIRALLVLGRTGKVPTAAAVRGAFRA